MFFVPEKEANMAFGNLAVFLPSPRDRVNEGLVKVEDFYASIFLFIENVALARNVQK